MPSGALGLRETVHYNEADGCAFSQNVLFCPDVTTSIRKGVWFLFFNSRLICKEEFQWNVT